MSWCTQTQLYKIKQSWPLVTKRLVSISSRLLSPFGFPRLSPRQVKSILRRHDMRVNPSIDGAVRYFESNQLAANNPIEDRRSEGRCLQTNAMLFGVFDGHGGCACAQGVSERLFYYLTIALMPPYMLANYMQEEEFTPQQICHLYHHDNDYVNEDRAHVYTDSLRAYANQLLSSDDFDEEEYDVGDVITKAFLRLDADICSEALPRPDGTLDYEALEIAFSGACSNVAYISGINLHIANAGDCRAVLVSINDEDDYVAKPLSNLHDSCSPSEEARIKSEHPDSESVHLIRGERLLGQLVPTRAFGDVTYKWSPSLLRQILHHTGYSKVVPPHYLTPPYLTPQPEVSHYKLTPRDRCLVLATDGLWDMLSTDDVARLIGKHIRGEQTVESYSPTKSGHATLADINRALEQRKVGLASRASDDNGATHLVRAALGRTDRGGIEHGKLSNMLCIPEDMVRSFRDDITVTVIYFNTEYIKQTCAVQQY